VENAIHLFFTSRFSIARDRSWSWRTRQADRSQFITTIHRQFRRVRLVFVRRIFFFSNGEASFSRRVREKVRR